MNWYLAVLKKYAVFEGRASRTEYWMYFLFSVIVSIILGVLDSILGIRSSYGLGLLGSLYSLAVLLPGLGVTIRRLHDTGRSGWWFLIVLVPFVGWIVLLAFMIRDSQPGDNQYGPSVKGSPAPAAAIS